MHREVKLTVLLNFVHIGLSTLIGFVTAPVLKDGLGVAQYGLYTLAFSILCYFALVEFGMGNILVRELVRLRRGGLRVEGENFLAHAALLYGCFAGAAAAVCGLAYAAAHRIFPQFSPALLADFRQMFLYAAASIAVLFLQNYFFSILTGFERFFSVRVIMVVKLLLRLAGVLILMALRREAYTVFMLDLILHAVCASLLCFLCLRRTGVRVRLHRFDRSLLRRIGAGCGMLYASGVIENVFWNCGGLFIGMIWGDREVASIGSYGIAITFCTVFILMSGSVAEYCLPLLSGIHAAETDASAPGVWAAFTGISRYTAAFLTLAFLLFVFAGRDFILLWMGAEYADVYPLTAILLSALLIPRIQASGETVLQAGGRLRTRFLLYLAIYPPAIGVTYLAVRLYGPSLAWVGIVAALTGFNLIGLNVYYRRLGLRLGAYIHAVLLPVALASVPALAAGCAMLALPVSLPFFLLKAFVICVCHGVSVWFFYLKPQERRVLHKNEEGA